MRFPLSLQNHGTIGFIAPSFGEAIEPYFSGFNNCIKKMEDRGFQLDLGPNCYLGEGVGISNTPQLCAKEFMDYYLSDQNDVLMSVGGGELMCEILEYIDFEAIKKAPPKWFMGYSDNTNLTFLLATICDVASIYGPCATSFGMEPWHPSIEDALKILQGEKEVVSGYPFWEKESLKDEEHPLLPYHCTETRKLQYRNCKQQDHFSGRLIGGCLDILVNLCGTKFDHVDCFLEKYKEEGFVWFIEACDLNVFSIRRGMWQLYEAGWFKYCKALLVGRPRNGEEMMGLDAYEAVMHIAEKLEVPVIFDLDIGHMAPMMPLIVGSYVDVTVGDNDISIEMKKIV